MYFRSQKIKLKFHISPDFCQIFFAGCGRGRGLGLCRGRGHGHGHGRCRGRGRGLGRDFHSFLDFLTQYHILNLNPSGLTFHHYLEHLLSHYYHLLSHFSNFFSLKNEELFFRGCLLLAVQLSHVSIILLI